MVLVLCWGQTLSDAGRKPSWAWNLKSESVSVKPSSCVSDIFGRLHTLGWNVRDVLYVYLELLPTEGPNDPLWSFCLLGVFGVIIRTSLSSLLSVELHFTPRYCCLQVFILTWGDSDRSNFVRLDFRNLPSASCFSSALLCMTRPSWTFINHHYFSWALVFRSILIMADCHCELFSTVQHVNIVDQTRSSWTLSSDELFVWIIDLISLFLLLLGLKSVLQEMMNVTSITECSSHFVFPGCEGLNVNLRV